MALFVFITMKFALTQYRLPRINEYLWIGLLHIKYSKLKISVLHISGRFKDWGGIFESGGQNLCKQ